MTTTEQLRAERRRLKEQYGDQFEWLSRLFFENDPIGINFGDNTDEYEPEVGTILPRIAECEGAKDLERVIHEEFQRWFDEDTAGPRERYSRIAELAWAYLRAST